MPKESTLGINKLRLDGVYEDVRLCTVCVRFRYTPGGHINLRSMVGGILF